MGTSVGCDLAGMCRGPEREPSARDAGRATVVGREGRNVQAPAAAAAGRMKNAPPSGPLPGRCRWPVAVCCTAIRGAVALVVTGGRRALRRAWRVRLVGLGRLGRLRVCGSASGGLVGSGGSGLRVRLRGRGRAAAWGLGGRRSAWRSGSAWASPSDAGWAWRSDAASGSGSRSGPAWPSASGRGVRRGGRVRRRGRARGRGRRGRRRRGRRGRRRRVRRSASPSGVGRGRSGVGRGVGVGLGLGRRASPSVAASASRPTGSGVRSVAVVGPASPDGVGRGRRRSARSGTAGLGRRSGSLARRGRKSTSARTAGEAPGRQRPGPGGLRSWGAGRAAGLQARPPDRSVGVGWARPRSVRWAWPMPRPPRAPGAPPRRHRGPPTRGPDSRSRGQGRVGRAGLASRRYGRSCGRVRVGSGVRLDGTRQRPDPGCRGLPRQTGT